jgi:type II secretory pathway component PulF
MGFFRYEAVDKTGKVVRGVMNARSEQEVTQNLSAMGYQANAIYGSSQAGAVQAAPSPPAAPVAAPSAMPARGGMQSVTLASGLPVSVKSSVNASALAGYFRQLATLVRSGMPLHLALSEMATTVRNPALRRSLITQQESARGGRNLSGALSEFPKVFPVHIVASVWAGELAGRLEVALDEIATDMELEASETRFGRIGWGIAKLHFLLLALLIPMSNLVALLRPALEESLKQGEVSTRQVLQYVLSTYMKTMFGKSMLAMGAMIVLWIALGYIKRIPIVRYALDAVVIHVPLWGRLHRDRALGRFLHVLNGLYASGISPGQAWDAACLTVRNSALADRLRRARRNSSPNTGVAELIAAAGLFTMEEVAMATTGEKTGQIPEVAENMSANYVDQFAARKTRNRIASVVIMELTAGVMVIYVFYKIMQSYGDLAELAGKLVGGQ